MLLSSSVEALSLMDVSKHFFIYGVHLQLYNAYLSVSVLLNMCVCVSDISSSAQRVSSPHFQDFLFLWVMLHSGIDRFFYHSV